MLNKLKRPTTLRILTGLFSIVVLSYASSGLNLSLIEELSIGSGVSWDIEKKPDLTYRQGILVYGESQKDDKGTDYIFTTRISTPASVREVRNPYTNKNFQNGFVRIYILGESLANLGIDSIVDNTTIENNPVRILRVVGLLSLFSIYITFLKVNIYSNN